MQDKNWISEVSYRGCYSQGFKIKSKLCEKASKFQKIEVYETEGFGKLLLLDGKTMVSDADEFVYHEVMAHLPMMVAKNPKRVLVIGGGDGGVVREFVKHPELEEIHLVEIDEDVINVSKEFFPDCTSGLKDKRVKVYTEDGFPFLKAKKNYYDIIIVDSTDPVDFAKALFTEEFYGMVRDALTADGIMMNQTENPFLDEYGIKDIYNNLRENFKNVHSFTAPMLIYPGVFWTFGFSSKTLSPTKLNPAKLEMMQKLQKTLKWYNSNWHQGAFSISNYHKKKIGEEL